MRVAGGHLFGAEGDRVHGNSGGHFWSTAKYRRGCLLSESGPETTREQNATLVPLLVALLTAEYRQLPAWAQTYFQYEYDAIATRLAAGDVAGALCIAQATSAPEALAPNQAAILALFPS